MTDSGANGGSPPGLMPRPLAILLALGAVTTSLAALAADSGQRERVSGDAAVERAVETVRERFAGGDAVITTPFWDRSAWQRLVGAGPGAERFPFPALLRSDRPDPLAILEHDRLWVLGLDGRPPAAPPSVAEAARLVEEVEIDGMTGLALYDLEEIRPLRTLTGDFDDLVVRRRPPGAEAKPCPRKGDRHRCGREPWFDVEIQDRDVYHQDVSWLFAHPGPGDIALEIDWPKLPAGAWLVLRAGFNQAAVRHEEGSEVTVTVLFDGVEAGRLNLPPYAYALERAYYLIPQGGPGRTARIVVQAADHDWRQVMLEGTVLNEVPEVLRRWVDEAP